jgi:rare lipoprotein A
MPAAIERPAEAQRPAMSRSAWPSLIASAHAATEDAVLTAHRPAPFAAPSGRIFIQAGMFAVAENAHRLRARFAGLTSTEVVRVTVNGTALYRVRLGPMASAAEARQLLERLTANGISDARVVSD